MNQLLQNFRAKFPDDTRSDAEINIELGEKLTQAGYNLDDYEDFKADYLKIQRAGRPGLFEEAGRGLSRGIDNLQGSALGLTALAGDAIESTNIPFIREVGGKLRDVGIEGFQRNVQQASENPAAVRSFRDVEGAADVPSYLTGLLGEALPSIGESILTGLAGAVVGSSAPGPGTAAGFAGGFLSKQGAKAVLRTQLKRIVGRELAEKELDLLVGAATRKELADVAKRIGGEGFDSVLNRVLRQARTARYSSYGAIGDSVAQNTGSTYNELYEKGAGQKERIVNSLVAGSFAGALDSAVPVSVMKRFFPGLSKKAVGDAVDEALDIGGDWKRRFGIELAKTSGTEGFTEALQEAIQEVAVANGVDDYSINQRDLIDRMINAAIAGALAGGVVGGSTSLYSARANPPDSETEFTEQDAEDAVDTALRMMGHTTDDIGRMNRDEKFQTAFEGKPPETQESVAKLEALRKEAYQKLGAAAKSALVSPPPPVAGLTEAFSSGLLARTRAVFNDTVPPTPTPSQVDEQIAQLEQEVEFTEDEIEQIQAQQAQIAAEQDSQAVESLITSVAEPEITYHAPDPIPFDAIRSIKTKLRNPLTLEEIVPANATDEQIAELAVSGIEWSNFGIPNFDAREFWTVQGVETIFRSEGSAKNYIATQQRRGEEGLLEETRIASNPNMLGRRRANIEKILKDVEDRKEQLQNDIKKLREEDAKEPAPPPTAANTKTSVEKTAELVEEIDKTKEASQGEKPFVVASGEPVDLDEFVQAYGKGAVFVETQADLGHLLAFVLRNSPTQYYDHTAISKWLNAFKKETFRLKRLKRDANDAAILDEDGNPQFEYVERKFDLDKGEFGYDLHEWVAFMGVIKDPHEKKRHDTWVKFRARPINKAKQGQGSVKIVTKPVNEETTADPNQQTQEEIDEQIDEQDATPVTQEEETVDPEVEQADAIRYQNQPFRGLTTVEVKKFYAKMQAAFNGDLKGASIGDKVDWLRLALFGAGDPKLRQPEFEYALRQVARYLIGKNDPDPAKNAFDFLIYNLIESYDTTADIGTAEAFRRNLAEQRIEETSDSEATGGATTQGDLNAPDPLRLYAQLPPGVVSALPAGLPRIDLATGRPVLDNEVIPDGEAAINYIFETTLNPARSKQEHIFRELESAGVPINARQYAVINEIFERLQEASPGHFDTLEITIAPDYPGPGSFNPALNRLTINPNHPLIQRGGLGYVVLHEMGHFFTTFVLGEHEAMPQWKTLTARQRTNALYQYLQDGGELSVNGTVLNGATTKAELLEMRLEDSYEAMHEWMAYQFSRVVEAGLRGQDNIKSSLFKEGLGNGIIDWIIRFYNTIREAVGRLLNLEPNHKYLDGYIQELMGFREKTRTYADPDSLSSYIKSTLNAPVPRDVALNQRPIFAVEDELAKGRATAAWSHNKLLDTILREAHAAVQATLNISYADFLKLMKGSATPEENMAFIEEQMKVRGLQLSKTEFEDIRNKETKDRTNYTVQQYLSYQIDEIEADRDKKEAELEKFQRQLQHKVKMLEKKIQTLSAADIQDGARQALKNLTDQAIQGLKLNSATGKQLKRVGQLTEIIRQLEGKATDKTVRPYVDAINEMLKGPGLVLFDLLDKISALQIDPAKVSVAQFRQFIASQSDADLRKLAADQYRFAAITALARDKLLREILVTRKLAPEARAEIKKIDAELRVKQSGVRADAKAAGKLERMGRIKERITRAYAEVRNARKKVEQREAALKTARTILPVLERRLSELIFLTGGANKQFLAHNSLLLNPANANSTIEEMQKNALPFTWLSSGDMAPEQWRALRMRLRAWLDNPANRKSFFYYNVVQKQYDEMVRQPAERALYEARSLSRQIWVGTLKHMSELLGIPEGEELSREMTDFQSILKQGARNMERNGLNVQHARGLLINELELGKTGRAFDEFTSKFAAPAKRRLEQPGGSITNSINYLRRLGRLKTDEQIKLMRRYLEASIVNDRYIKELMKSLGLTVSDDMVRMSRLADGQREAIERPHINIGTETFVHAPNLGALRLAILPNRGFFEFLRTNRGKYTELTQALAGASDMRLFMEPIIKNADAPVFTNAQGEFIMSSDAEAIWDAVGQDPVAFLQATALQDDLEPADLEAHVITQLDNLYEVFRIADKVVVQSEKTLDSFQSKSGDVPSHVAMDARTTNILPPEWIGYREASEADNKLLLTSIAFHGAFGRDGAKIFATIASAKDFFVGLNDRRNRLRKEAEDAGLTGEAVDKYVEKAVGNKQDYKRMIHAKRSIERIDRIRRDFEGVFSHELGPNKELGAINEFLHLQVKAILNGPKNAFLQSNQLLFSPLRLGFSKEAFLQAWFQGKAFIESMGGSLFSALDKDWDRASEDARLRAEVFGADPSIGTELGSEKYFYGARDQLRPELDDLNLANRSRRVFHFINRVLDRGVSKASPENAIFRAFRGWAPFTQLVGDLSEGAMTAYARTMDRLVMKAMKYFHDHPEAARDPKFSFRNNKAALREMGYANSLLNRNYDAFLKIHNQLTAEVGIDLESHVRDLLSSGAKRPFTNSQYARIMQLGVDDLSSDGNYLTTRATWLKKGPTQYFSYLLGWSATAPHAFARLFKGPKGEVTKHSMMSGMMTLMLAVIPSTLAFSVLMDWWDEYLIGRKNSHRPLFSGGPKDFLIGANERFTRMGIAGIPYEVVNLALNVGGESADLRTVSLDQRVVIASTIRNMAQTFGTFLNQETATWATVGRPLFQQFGAGLLQQLDIANALGMPTLPIPGIGTIQESERRFIARLNARNYLRTAGKILNLEVRNSAGYYSTPTPMTPWVTQMILAAYGADTVAFREARARAMEAALEMGKKDPEGAVRDSFAARHPLKTLFRTAPTTDEYLKMLEVMNERGKSDTTEAINLINAYGKMIGITPYEGKREKKSSISLSLLPF